MMTIQMVRKDFMEDSVHFEHALKILSSSIFLTEFHLKLSTLF